MMTVRDIARKLNCSNGCVYRLINHGTIPHVRVGLGRGTIRVDEADLEAFIKAQRTGRVRLPDDTPPRQDLKSFAG